jgi:hypothetical protein
MKNTVIMAIALAGALTSFSQDSGDAGRPGRGPGGPGRGGPGGPGRGRGIPPLIVALDANKDGKIDASEIANAAKALAALDKNGDGIISNDESRPPRPADAPEPPADAPKRPMPAIMKALDTDEDGALNATEVTNAPAALAKLDKNGDGILTPDEFMGMGPRGEGRGPGRPGGPEGGRGPRGEGRGPRNGPQSN